jgi:hypothetical protein
MTDFDLDRLGEMWRTEPDPAEMEKLRLAAEGIARNARLAQFFDAAFAIIVSAIVLFLALSNPKPQTLILGAGAIALMLFGTVRQRRLRQVELESLSGTAEQMLDQSIGRLRATIRRTRLALISLTPAFVIGLGFGMALDGGLIDQISSLTTRPWAPLAFKALVVGLVGLGMVHYLRTIPRNRGELERLTALRESFRHETETGES